jgi:hypothetical protein
MEGEGWYALAVVGGLLAGLTLVSPAIWGHTYFPGGLVPWLAFSALLIVVGVALGSRRHAPRG